MKQKTKKEHKELLHAETAVKEDRRRKMKGRTQKKFSFIQPAVLIGCLIFVTGLFSWNKGGTAQAADTVSREEWVHLLAETFQMTIEDGLMPDDYYKDVSQSSSSYYEDIMTAVNFGVIDLEAGEEFRPKEDATREFAAQTLNFCLGYELEDDPSYAMKDIGDLTYPKEDQTALNQGWLTLIAGEFCPDKPITSAEKTRMINFAKQVLADAEIDGNHQNTYEFAEHVIVIPEGTEAELGENRVRIYGDPGAELAEGDVFAVFSNGIAYTYQAVNISRDSDWIEIETIEADYRGTVESYDAEGMIEADLGDFVPASDDMIMDVEYEEEAAGQEGIAGHADARAKKNVKDIRLSKNVGGGKVSCVISNIQVNYKMDGSGYLFSVSGNAKLGYTLSGKKSLTIPIGYVNIAGVGKIQVTMVYAADGSAALTFSSDFVTGIEKTGGSVRKIKSFTTPSWHFSAQAELKAACKISFDIAIPAIASGNLYAELGVKSTPDVEVYSDGRKPVMCMDLPAYLYAEAGYSVNVAGQQVAKETVPIYTASNSPVKVCFHIEDGINVSVCSRLDSSSRVGKRGYYSLLGAAGTYGSQCFPAPEEEVKIFEYELDDAGHATITKYSGNVYALIIPEELDGHPVIAIGERAFKGNSSLGSVVVPDGVESIGKEAFYGCGSLEDVVLPENRKYTSVSEGVFAENVSLRCVEIPKYVSDIQKRAFYHCGLISLRLSEDITYIGEKAFYGCARLSDLILPKYLETYGAACFGDCDSLQRVEVYKYLKENDYFPDYHAMVDNGYMSGMFYGCDNLKEVCFVGGVTRIASNLFNGCTGLEEVTIPDTVTHIGLHAFNACTSLKKVNLPDSLTKIDIMAFRNCTSLESVSIPDSVTEIGCRAFYGCGKLSEVHLPEKLKILGTQAFSGCSSLQAITIPPNTAEVPQYYDGYLTGLTESPFSSCANLKEITLAEGMQKVAGFLFKNCGSLESIAMPDSVTEIGESAFSDAASLQNAALSKHLTSIDRSAFKNCASLERIELPDTIKEMAGGIFEGCSLLTEVKLPKYRVGISAGTFKNCTSLTGIQFPETLQYIYENAFEGCERLESITLPDEFKGIEKAAFKNCKRLASVELKGDYVGENAFENCMELTEVKMQDSIYRIGKCAFLNCSGITGLHLSTGLEQIAANLFEGCTYLDNLVIPWGVTEIGAEAFKNCTRLKHIYIPENTSGIAENAFSYPEEITVYGVEGSYAQQYADHKNMIFSAETAAVEGLNFQKESYAIKTGQSIKTAVLVLPETANASLQWSSSDEGIATVSKGWVTGENPGECVITVRGGEAEASCRITVKDGFGSFQITGRETMQVEETQQLFCADADGNKLDAREFRWWSDNPNIASVDQEGNLKALKKGTVKIEAWLLENAERQAEITIKVTDKVEIISVEAVKIVPPDNIKENGTVKVGDQFVLSAVVSPSNATNKNVKWDSSNKSVAAITAKGAVSAVGVGKATFTVTSEDGGKKAEFKIQVIKGTQGQNPGSGTEKPGTDKPGSGTGKPGTDKPGSGTEKPGSSKPGTLKQHQITVKKSFKKILGSKSFSLNARSATGGKLSYSSSNLKVAKIDSKGKVKIAGVGKTVFTITAHGDKKYTVKKVKVTLTVIPKTVTGVKAKAQAGRKCKVSWKNLSKVSGYQIRYSQKSGMKSAKSVKAAGAKKKSITLKKLKGGKKYYIQVRAYQRAGGKTYYGNWSRKKSVRVKN